MEPKFWGMIDCESVAVSEVEEVERCHAIILTFSFAKRRRPARLITLKRGVKTFSLLYLAFYLENQSEPISLTSGGANIDSSSANQNGGLSPLPHSPSNQNEEPMFAEDDDEEPVDLEGIFQCIDNPQGLLINEIQS